MTVAIVLLLLILIGLLTQIKRGGVWPKAAAATAGLAILLIAIKWISPSGPPLSQSDQGFFNDLEAAAHRLGTRIREEVPPGSAIILLADQSSTGVIAEKEQSTIRGLERGLGKEYTIHRFDPRVHGRPDGYDWHGVQIIPRALWNDMWELYPNASAVVSFMGLPPISRDAAKPAYALATAITESEIQQWKAGGGRGTVLAMARGEDGEQPFEFVSEVKRHE